MFQFVTDNRSMISKAENARSPIHFLQCWRQMPFHQGDRGWRDKDMPSNITLARENNFSSRCKKSSVPKSKRSTPSRAQTHNGQSENLTSSKFALSPLCFLWRHFRPLATFFFHIRAECTGIIYYKRCC